MAAYAELHCKTNFTFLEGASHPEEMVERAAALGYSALAITDRNTVAGVVRAHTAAKELGFPLLIGAEVTPVDAVPLVLLAINRAGYAGLCRLLTLGRRRAEKGSCHLLFSDVAGCSQDLIACVPLIKREISTHPSTKLRAIPEEQAVWQGSEQWVQSSALRAYRELFGDRCYALGELAFGPDDGGKWEIMQETAQEAGCPLAVAGDVYFHDPSRQPLCDVLQAIRWGCTVAQAGGRLFSNAQRYLKPIPLLRRMFARSLESLALTTEIASRCQFSMDELRYEYPRELAPSGEPPLEYLKRLTWEGAKQRYPRGVPPRVRAILEHELALIGELHYEAYFLTVWDLVRFARQRGILCQGRGSAANSAVCFCLGVTSVDPDRLDVLFERFISKERDEAPDIDVDFEHERREEVLQYIYDKYGRDRAGMTAEVITYCARSAVREVGKALGVSLDRIDQLAAHLEGYKHEPDLTQRFSAVGLEPESPLVRQWAALSTELIGFPRHLSQHVGGMVITRGPLSELVPIENAAMEGRTVIVWNKDDLDALGILKVDCLALGMLTAIRKCFDLVEKHHGRKLTLADVPEGDQKVYDMICRADTIGVFQIESRAQMSMLPRLKPRCYYDLVIEVAIVRPGPIQGDMVHPYLRRREGLEVVSYPSDAIRQVLEKTLGVPLFQEQAMRLAVVAAGFTPGEADQLRRAMAAWRRPGVIDEFRRKLLQGMQARGLTEEFAERVFRQIRGFGEYGFPESHAASFALLVYVSCWLKYYYPAAFAAAVINSQPMGFYAPAQLIRCAKEHGVSIRPIDVNTSHWDCTLETCHSEAGEVPPRSAKENPAEPNPISSNEASRGNDEKPRGEQSGEPVGPAIRLGMRLVAGLSQKHAEAVLRARGRGKFHSVEEFTRRTRLPRQAVSRLAEADAFHSLDLNRRQALWESLAQEANPRHTPLFKHLPFEPDEEAALPRLSPAAETAADYISTGLSLRTHPIAFFRGQLNSLGALCASQLAAAPLDRPVKAAGLVLMRQRPSTAKGIIFVTLEDETGVINLVVHPKTWERHHQAARTASALLVTGRLQREGMVIHVIAAQLEDLSRHLMGIPAKSRDFR